MAFVKNHFIILVLLLTSCNVLDQEPQDKIATSQAFSSESNAQKALNGLYNEIQSVYDWRIQIIGDLPSDITQSIDTWDAFINIDEFTTTQDNSEIEDLYTIIYRAIDIANNIVTEVPKLQLALAKENDLVGQALCIRGLMYFELCRIWGGVPGIYGTEGVIIRTKPSKGLSDDSYGYRASLSECYGQCQKDFEEALQLLPEGRESNELERGRVIKPTAKALLARFHLYNKNYTLAETYATTIIDDTRYQLVKPFDLIFKSKNTLESIFEIQFSESDVSGLRHWYFPPALGGRGGLALHEEFYNELIQDPSDDRGKLVALNANMGVYYPIKYSLTGNADNTHVIRIAEMFLIRAEARTHLGNYSGAIDDISKVRARSSQQKISAETKEDLIDAILKERKLEFFEEGHRWFDLVRTGKALSVLKNLTRKTGSQLISLNDEGRLVFPFPISELQTNPNMKQNNAYK